VPNIFDNITDNTRLGLALRESLKDFDTVDVATGYLDLRGWSSFADILDTKQPTAAEADRPTARVLIGMVAPSDSQQILESLQEQVQPPAYGADIHDRKKALARRDQLVKHLRNQLMRGLATTEGQNTLQTLKLQLEEGVVEMKVFTEKPLHGKTYLFHAPAKKHGARWGYVGSSNLTGAGLNRNLELNIDVQDSDATIKLATWFEDRWDDPFSRPDQVRLELGHQGEHPEEHFADRVPRVVNAPTDAELDPLTGELGGDVVQVACRATEPV